MRSRTYVSLLLIAGCCFGFRPALARFEFSELHMGTQFKIILYCERPDAAILASNAFERIAQVDAITSDYRETSELMAVCKTAVGRKIRVSEDLFRVLAKSQEMAEQSGGAFDVTIGPIVRLWRRARRIGELPDRLRLAKAMDLIGHQKLHLDRESRSVSLDRNGMLLDLGGIAKGYAVDEAMSVLRQKGVARALIAAGGDILVSGAPPGTQGWLIDIAPLEPGNGSPTRSLYLRDQAVSTSGDAHQHVEISGVRYSHIVDPKTGLGVTGRSSVTVVARNCTTSDALATAASVLGSVKGAKLIESTPGAAALFVQATAEGLSTVETNRWKNIRKAGERARSGPERHGTVRRD
jgi:FAD:protein FMN transferase